MEKELHKFFADLVLLVVQMRALSREASRLAAVAATLADDGKRDRILEDLSVADESLRDAGDKVFAKSFPDLYPVRHRLDELATQRK